MPRSYLPALPLLAGIAAAAAVVVTLGLLHAVVWTLVLYHLAICLALPLADSLVRRGISGQEHGRLLGLAGAGARSGVVIALALSPLFAAGALGGIALARSWLPLAARIPAVLASWGAEPARMPALSVVLVAANGAAEELFWRGWVQGRLREAAGPAVAIGMTAALFTLYHVYTLSRLLGAPAVVIPAVLLVAAVGMLWGWLRELTGSLWPPLLGHTAVTAAYVAGYWLWIAPAAR